MVEFLYRPSPQVPKPTDRAALRCFASSSFIVKLSSQQIKTAAVDVTWVFVLTLYSALNTLLWTLSYPDVRAAHTREEVMELVGIATDVVEQCSHRWPGSTPASQLYLVLAKACMQSYDLKRDAPAGLDTPSTMITSSPSTPASSTAGAMSSTTTTTQQAQHLFNTQFGYVFDASQAPPYGFSPTEAIEHNKIAHPTFRSNSIFLHPATNMHDRRASSFPPDFPEQKFKPSSEAHALDESTPPATQTPHGDSASPPAPSPFLSQTSPPVMEPGFDTLPTPPDTLEPAPSFLPDVQGLSPTPTVTTLKASSPPPPITQELSPVSLGLHSSPLQAPQPKFEPGFIDSALPNQLLLQQQQQQQQRCLQTVKQEASMLPPPSTTRSTGFTIPPPQPQAQLSSQRPLPQGTTVTNWFNPAPPFISPYANFPPPSNGMNGTAGGYWGNDDSAVTTSRAAAGGTLSASTSASAASLYNAAGLGLGHVNNFPSGSGRGDGLGPAQLPPGMTPDGYGLYRGGIDGMQFAYDTPLGRHGSLSQEQQMELMQVLETEGMGDINNYLTMGMGLGADPAGASGWR